MKCAKDQPPNATQHCVPADIAARPKIGGILQSGFMPIRIPAYWSGVTELDRYAALDDLQWQE